MSLGAVKYLVAVVFAASVGLSVAAAFSSGSVAWGLTLAVCFLICIAGTITALRWRTRAMVRAMTQTVAAGEVLWGAQVRETIPGGRWGLSGGFLLDTNGTLKLIPDSPSLKRGAVAQSWSQGQVRMALLTRKRDVTGLRYTLLEVQPRDGGVRRFAVFDLAGDLPPGLRTPTQNA